MPAADTARLVAELALDDKKFSRGMANANKSLGSLDKALGRAGQGINTAAGNLAKLGAIGGGLAVAGLAAAVGEASNLNEQLSKSTVVFGEASKEVIAFSETTADSLGLAQSATLEAAGAFGNMFKTTGLAEGAAADMSIAMVELAADMASFNNEDPNEMLDKLRSGLSGEAEPLRRFGVLLSESAVAAEAVASGIADADDELTEAQKVQARYSLILKQTKVQQGDFARTSGSLANQQRILAANLRNTGATIGTALLPKITEIAVKINKLITKNQPAIEAFAAQLPGAFDRAVAFAERIPWGTIADGLQAAAGFAGDLLDVFLNMPPEVQTTLIALAGLNKLSGGAVTGVVSELSKGLIKGVLGMTAGVVNLKAGTVVGTGVGGGGLPVPAGGGKGGGGVIGALGTVGKFLGVVGIATISIEAATAIGQAAGDAFDPKLMAAIRDPSGASGVPLANRDPSRFNAAGQVVTNVGGVPASVTKSQQETAKALGENARLQNISNERLESIQGYTKSAAATAIQDTAKSERADALIAQRIAESRKATDDFKRLASGETRAEIATIARASEDAKRAAAIASINSGSERAAIANAAAAQTAAQARTTEAARSAAAAIRDKDLSVTVNVPPARISIANFIDGQRMYTRLHNVAS